MFESFARKFQQVFHRMGDVLRKRRAQKAAKVAEIEKRERKAIVSTLVKKLEAARAECEEQGRSHIEIELSLKEIVFIEWNLAAWTRHFKESQIFATPASERTQR